jgi:superfamily I DNA/RNA helicase
MFFGDVAQQVYGTRISWRSAGLRSPKIWHFEQNYRNSKQIAQLGIAISKMPFFQGEVDLVVPREPKAEGPPPTLVKCRDKDSEFNMAIELAMRMRKTQMVAILMRNRDMESAYTDKFRSESVSIRRIHRNMQAWTSQPGIFLGTYHAAKGLEFDSVILPYCSSDVIPDQSRIKALGDVEDALAEEGRLLYVAVTRARTNLIISYSGEITPLLPADDNLYQKIER